MSGRSEVAVTAGLRHSIPMEPKCSQKFQQECWIFATPGSLPCASRLPWINLQALEGGREREGGAGAARILPDAPGSLLQALDIQMFTPGPLLQGCTRPGLEMHPQQDGASSVFPAQ